MQQANSSNFFMQEKNIISSSVLIVKILDINEVSLTSCVAFILILCPLRSDLMILEYRWHAHQTLTLLGLKRRIKTR